MWCKSNNRKCERRCRNTCKLFHAHEPEKRTYDGNVEMLTNILRGMIDGIDIEKCKTIARILMYRESIAFNKGVYAQNKIVHFKYKGHVLPFAKSQTQQAVIYGYEEPTPNFHYED